MSAPLRPESLGLSINSVLALGAVSERVWNVPNSPLLLILEVDSIAFTTPSLLGLLQLTGWPDLTSCQQILKSGNSLCPWSSMGTAMCGL